MATGIGGLRFFASNNDNGAKTKVQVLTESLDPHVHQQTLKLSASKAKIHDIKQTLQLTKLWGFHDPRLKAALQENEASYCRGKESVAVSLSC